MKYIVLRTLILGLIVTSECFAVEETEKLISNNIKTGKPISPEHVYGLAMLLKNEVNDLRLEMGKPEVGKSLFTVKNAAPREVYFQAINLFRKASRFKYEMTSLPSDEPETPKNKLKPQDVWNVLNSSLALIRQTKQNLNIAILDKKPVRTVGKTSTDAYMAIMDINKQLGNLLSTSFSPTDVYMETTKALEYTLALRLIVSSPRMGEQFPYINKKQPADVYALLIEIYSIISDIVKKSGYKTLELHKVDSKIIEPTDVYDIIVLILSQLQFIHKQANSAVVIYDPVYPGVKFPSHVYQRALLLKKQVKLLSNEIGKNIDRADAK